MRVKQFIFFIAILALLLGLTGCGEQDTAPTLWVLTEQSTSDGMNLQAKIIAERMEEKYDGLTIHLDILPTDSQEREILLKQLRTQIMAGKGPDVFLLPTGDRLTYDYAVGYLRDTDTVSISPLFADVTQIMRDRLFADLSAYYDSDSDLDKDGLKAEVMDAGVLDGSRYVLPFRYTMPVLMTAPEDWAENGLTLELLGSGVGSLTDTALRQGNTAVLTGLQLPQDASLLPRLFDYEAEKVLVTPEEIASYMRTYQAWKAVAAKSSLALSRQWYEYQIDSIMDFGVIYTEEVLREKRPFEGNFQDFGSLQKYIEWRMNWHTAGLPLFTCSLASALETAVVSKQAKFETVMLPLGAMDGSVVASVSYYGAVGCGCRQPALAYEFLRQFLTEEFQWDIARPRSNKNVAPSSYKGEAQTRGLLESSWPVRAGGAVPYLFDTLKYQEKGAVNHYLEIQSYGISRHIQSLHMTGDEFPPASFPIDEVRFPVYLKGEESINYALSLLNEEDGTPTDVDIDQLARQVYQNLCYHLGEG